MGKTQVVMIIVGSDEHRYGDGSNIRRSTNRPRL